MESTVIAAVNMMSRNIVLRTKQNDLDTPSHPSKATSVVYLVSDNNLNTSGQVRQTTETDPYYVVEVGKELRVTGRRDEVQMSLRASQLMKQTALWQQVLFLG